MPTPSSATTHSTRQDPLSQLGRGGDTPPVVAAPRKRQVKKKAAPVEPPGQTEAEQTLSPPLPRPAERGGAKGTVSKFIRFDLEGANRLEAAAEELRCSQTDLVKSAVTYYLDLLERERDQGGLAS